VEGHAITDVADDPDDVASWFVIRHETRESDEAAVQRIAIGPVTPRHGLIDNSNGRRPRTIAVDQRPALHNRYVEYVEVLGRNDAIAHDRWLVQRTIHNRDARAPVRFKRQRAGCCGSDHSGNCGDALHGRADEPLDGRRCRETTVYEGGAKREHSV